MNAENFCQWLQGCLDILETKTLNTKQLEIIKEKLATVNDENKSSIHAKKPINISSNYPPQDNQRFYPPNVNFDTVDSRVGIGHVKDSHNPFEGRSYSSVGTYLSPGEYNISGTWNHNAPSTISHVRHSNHFPVSRW